MRVWDVDKQGKLNQITSILEKPSEKEPNVGRRLEDAYLDTKDNLHLVYAAYGPSTKGERTVRYTVIDAEGVTTQVPFPTCTTREVYLRRGGTSRVEREPRDERLIRQ